MTKHFYDLRQLFFLHLKRRWKPAPCRDTSPTPLVTYVFTSYLAHWPSLQACVCLFWDTSVACVSEAYRSLSYFHRLSLLWRYCVIDLQKTWKEAFSWTLNPLLGTTLLPKSHLQYICCRTRRSAHDTTSPIHCNQTCTGTTCCVQYLFC